uniref:PTS system mannose/fructose/sorbose family transporter subunit IID n=1 Tax=Olsenella timonensis TaxID=1805478 RepID=UPI00094E25DA|nr:PTS system mannose/fructose/sorbose family transporter subunit IID [Olsenella timonensis]
MTTSSSEKKLTKKELRQVFWRSCMLDSSWNYERQQNIGYSYAMTPVVKKLHEDGSEKQRRAYARGLDFMAVTPQLSTLLMGINAAMEEENANNEDFDDSTIVAVKTSLMGPLAGIGDSLIAATLRIIATGVAIGFSQQGSLLGPILLLLIFNIPGFAIRYLGLKFGYHYGQSFIKNAAKDGVMEKVTLAASIVGLMAIGGMVASYVSLDLPIIVGSGDFAQPLTDYFDMIMPCLTQILLFALMYWILGRKGVKTVWVLVATIVVCIGACWIGSLL